MGRERKIRGIVPLGSISGAVDIDASRGNVFFATLVGDVVFSVVNTKPGHAVWVHLAQDATGFRSVAWNGAGGGTVSPAPYVAPPGGAETMVTLVPGTTIKGTSAGATVEAHESFTSGSPTLVPSAGGHLNVLSGTVANPVLPDASLWIDQSIVVYLDNIAAGVTVAAAAGDLINGSATYIIAGAYNWATFYSISANKIGAAPAL